MNLPSKREEPPNAKSKKPSWLRKNQKTIDNPSRLIEAAEVRLLPPFPSD
jgi:hypothetical protein